MIDNPYGKLQKRVYISDVKCIFFDYLSSKEKIISLFCRCKNPAIFI